MFGPNLPLLLFNGELSKTQQSVPSTDKPRRRCHSELYTVVAVIRTVFSKRHISEILSVLYRDIV